MTISETIISLAVCLLTAGAASAIVYAVIKRRRIRFDHSQTISARASPRNQQRRMPYRVDAPRSLPVRAVPALPAEHRRMPRPFQNNESLRYRKCPRCHSENTLAKQYIYKTGEHSYYCSRCDHRFDF